MEDKIDNGNEETIKVKYVMFSKDFMYVESDGGDKINIPDFVSKSFNRYRWDERNKMIEKQCYTCKNWFPVLKLIDKKFVDVHDELEIHLMKGKSGFSTRCKNCECIYENNRVEFDSKIEHGKNEKQSVYFKAEYKEYLNKASVLRGVSIADILNRIIEKEIKEHPIEKLLEKFNENIKNTKKNNKK